MIKNPLISNENKEDVLQAANIFSSTISHNYLLEKELNSNDKSIDFSFYVCKKINKLIDTSLNEQFDNKLLKNENWNKVINAYLKWEEKDEKSKKMRHIGIGIDNSEIGKEIPQPIFYICPKIKEVDSFYLLEILEEVQSLSDKTKENFIDIISNMSDEVGEFYIGLMLSRDTNKIRIHFYDKTKNLKKVLNNINWNGDYEKFKEKIEDYKETYKRVGIEFNIGKEIDNDLNIVLGERGVFKTQNNNDWKDLLNKLEDNNLCTKKEKKNLLDFNYSINCISYYYNFMFKAVLSEIKVPLNDDSPAKIYLQIIHS